MQEELLYTRFRATIIQILVGRMECSPHLESAKGFPIHPHTSLSDTALQDVYPDP
jgi:hypothetical protein